MIYEIKFSPRAQEDLLYWAKNDRKKLARIKNLLSAMQKDPFSGIGKPEPLKFSFSGFWSRRITQEHRIIYSVESKEIMIANCRSHYSK
jgi:toxin YoeB